LTVRSWDAATYHRVSAPQQAMARDVLDRLELHGDETVLDAGCGSGRVTRMLLERLPHGNVIAVDAAAVCLGPYLARLDEADHAAFLDAVSAVSATRRGSTTFA